MIKKSFSPSARRLGANRRPITAGTSITSGVRTGSAMGSNVSFRGLNQQQTVFARQIMANCRKAAMKSQSILGATNTTNIAARPDFLELLPMFVQKLILLDVFGSVAMNSRQQLVPYFKFIAENTKGETKKGTILSSPMINRQGADPNFTGRVVKNEIVSETAGSFTTGDLAYLPVLPGSLTVYTTISGVTTPYTDDGAGSLLTSAGASAGTIDYASGTITLSSAATLTAGDSVKATYQYDNENVGPNANGKYGAQMGKGYLQLDEINLIAEAHQLASYWSLYSAFSAQNEYGSDLGQLAKEAAFSEVIAEINATGFNLLADVASYNTAYNWDATPVVSASVVPSDYLNMFKLKLEQAAAGVYSATRLARPNRIVCGTNTAAYIKMIQSFDAEPDTDTVGPYKLGRLDNFEVYVAPDYDPNTWVMCCKSNDIRRNSVLFGEYMPLTETQPIQLADMSIQQGYATMYAMEPVNKATIVGGKIIGVF